MSRAPWSLLILLGFGLAAPALGEVAPPDPTLDLLGAEVVRLWGALVSQPEPAHWLAVDTLDLETLNVQATHGAANPPYRDLVRLGDLDLRVGTPLLDSTHKIRDAGWFAEDPSTSLDLPFVDTPDHALRMALWRTADDAYRTAQRRLGAVRNNTAVKVAREDLSADFSAAPVVVDLRQVPALAIDAEAWRDRLREVSKVFLSYPEVYDSNVSLEASRSVERFASSEGSRLRHGALRLRVSAWAATVAEDGMQLQVYDYREVAAPEHLPDAAALEALARGVAEQLVALRRAPLIDPYAGPAILRGRAAAVFFHEILGHRLEGHRQKDEDEGQTLTEKVGQAILPPFLDVTDDPTLATWDGVDLSGHYAYDNEGVPAERVVAVDDGVLYRFLMSRSPIHGFERSNGHGRRQAGSTVVARQGNLLVQASQTLPYAALRARLIDEIKRQKKPYGLIFDDISGGFTFTGRSTPNAFSVQPVVVWRVYADGRADELVRGVDLIGTPLVAFGRILAASDQMSVFNGVCGAESGWVPVSAVAPDLLLSEVEVQRREKQNDRPPLLPPPGMLLPGGRS